MSVTASFMLSVRMAGRRALADCPRKGRGLRREASAHSSAWEEAGAGAGDWRGRGRDSGEGRECHETGCFTAGDSGWEQDT